MLIGFVEDTSNSREEPWKGYLYSGTLFGAAFLGSVFMNYSSQVLFRVGMNSKGNCVQTSKKIFSEIFPLNVLRKQGLLRYF